MYRFGVGSHCRMALRNTHNCMVLRLVTTGQGSITIGHRREADRAPLPDFLLPALELIGLGIVVIGVITSFYIRRASLKPTIQLHIESEVNFLGSKPCPSAAMSIRSGNFFIFAHPEWQIRNRDDLAMV